jgi:hypothetical protein
MRGITGTKYSSPGRTDQIVVEMQNKGRMLENAQIKMVLPEAFTYSIEAIDIASVSMTECGGYGASSPCPTLTGTWDTTNHILSWVVTGGTIGELGFIKFSFTGKNPPHTIAQQWGEVSKYSQVGTNDATDCIDGYCGSNSVQLVVSAIKEGPLSATSFVHGISTANQKSTLTLQFTLASPLFIGQMIRFDFGGADGWTMSSTPSTTVTTSDSTTVACSSTSWDSTNLFLDCVVDADIAEDVGVQLVVADVTTPGSQRVNSYTLSMSTYTGAQATITHDFEAATLPVTSLQGLYSDQEGVVIVHYQGQSQGWNKGGWDYSGGSLGTQPVAYADTLNTNPNTGGSNLFRSDYNGASYVGSTSVGEYRTPLFDLGVGDITAEWSGSGNVAIGLYEYTDTPHQGRDSDRLLKTSSPSSTNAELTQFTWSAASLADHVGKHVFIKVVDSDTSGFIAVDNLAYPGLFKIDGGTATIPASPAGRLLSYPRWDTATDKPDQDTSVTVSFRTNGKLPTGGSIVMQLPDYQAGWGTHGNPVVTFSEPSGATGTVTVAGVNNRWEVSMTSDIDEDTIVEFVLSGVHTASEDTVNAKGQIYTAFTDGYAIDTRTLFVDSLHFGRTQLMSGAQYGAYCPNSCSRHGTCRNFGRCTCYSRPGSDEPAWTENDCSLRTCPKGKAWSDLASGNHEAHAKEECSMAGTCNRKTGECECFSGYEGKACERSLCPNDCNGRGRCVTQEILAYEASKTYSEPWDAQKEAGCVCDIGARGPDCSLEECATGVDPRGSPKANSFGRDCSGRGICDYSTGLCHCFSGFYGVGCSLKAEFG